MSDQVPLNLLACPLKCLGHLFRPIQNVQHDNISRSRVRFFLHLAIIHRHLSTGMIHGRRCELDLVGFGDGGLQCSRYVLVRFDVRRPDDLVKVAWRVCPGVAI